MADRVRVEAEDEAARLAAVMADGQQFIGWPDPRRDAAAPPEGEAAAEVRAMGPSSNRFRSLGEPGVRIAPNRRGIPTTAEPS